MAHGQNMHARLQGVTDSAIATLILARIVYWHKAGKGRTVDGKKWTVNSYAEWGAESLFSIQQTRDAFRVFRDRHLVETIVAKTKRGRVLHTRPTDRTLAAIAGAENEDTCSLAPGHVLPATPTHVPLEHAIEQGDTQGVTQGEDSETLPDGSVPPPFANLKQGAGEDKEEIGNMKVHEVEKHVKGHAHMHHPDSVKALEFLWKSKLAEEGGEMVVLKAKEYGQLKQFQKLCPPGEALAVLTWVLDDWNGYSKTVMSDAGLKSTPASPQIGFVLQWSAQAVMGWTEAMKPTPKQTAKQEATAVIASKPAQLISQDEYPASIEEIMGLTEQGKPQ